MPRGKPDLAGKSASEVAQWMAGKTLSEVVDAMGITPKGRFPVVSFVPKNGRHNRCSMCRTGVSAKNVIGHPMEVSLLSGEALTCLVIVCSDVCERRLRDRHS